MQVKKSIEINAPAEHIWPYLTDPEKVMQWYFNLQEFKYTGDQNAGVGIPIYLVEKGPGIAAKLDFSVTEWAENEVVAIRKVSEGAPKVYEQRWHIEANNGESTFTFYEEIQMPWGFLGRLVESLMKGNSERTIDKMLQILKDKVEVG
jgi:carbon monoxide dehydrogenase subunit G